MGVCLFEGNGETKQEFPILQMPNLHELKYVLNFNPTQSIFYPMNYRFRE